MKHRYPLLIPTVLLLCSSVPASAQQFRCDCTSVVDSCSADVAIRGNWVEITTDHQQCARVDYFIDGLPFVSLVVDGQGREDWNARTDQPRVLVQSCQVCRENPAASADASASRPSRQAPAAESPDPSAQPSSAAGSENAEGLQALIEVPPTYPAAGQGRRGYVDLQITVGPQGNVQNASVTASEPASVFDQAALAAIMRWRYPAEDGREPQTVTERIEFRPTAATGAAATGAVAAPAAVQRAANFAGNDCVREGSVFNYGEMVEVGLVNACDAPIVVFGCAPGTGGNQGRWMCASSELQQSALVRSDDDRVGSVISVSTENGVSPLTYTDRFFVSRAPNSEYWWLACGIEDDACRENARQWTRSLDRQVANVDPQARSSVTVARSY